MSTKLNTKPAPTVQIIDNKATIVRVRWGLETKRYEYMSRILNTGEREYHNTYEKAHMWVMTQLKDDVIHQHVLLTSKQGV